jgi:hypothetical protein
MAKLSNLFGRKSGEISAGRGNGNGDHHVIENFSDVGSRMGEENEALRNLLSDTGRKIGELDELKEAFDKIVAPFNSTLRALEQEKAQTLGLAPNSTRSRRRQPRSKPKPRNCASTSNWRASRTARSKARAWREHADHDPRAARQGGDQFRGSPCRT